ncbi:MAG TPA: biliverdin-producing heme oxygenase [Kofleriaceae bacterium]|nr:biliverdin-producing heme oxygenase [Kofleriaceae bacterium]
MKSWALTRLERRYGDRADTVDTIVQATLLQPSRESYRRYLCDLYGFIVAFEARLAYAYTLDVAFIQERIKSGRISSDLLALGLTPYERVRLSQRCVVPALDNAFKALGWLYVVERMMRSLPRLYHRLYPALANELDQAGAFLGTPAEEIASSWIGLGHVLDRHVHSKIELERTLISVREALECLEQWVLLPAGSSIEIDAEQLRWG